MPSFNAGTIVEGLDYTFQPFAASSGTITEPSDTQLGQFLAGLKEVMTGSLKDMGLTATAIAEAGRC